MLVTRPRRWPIFLPAERVGLGGTHFFIWKFGKAPPWSLADVGGNLYPHLVIFFAAASSQLILERQGSVFRSFT